MANLSIETGAVPLDCPGWDVLFTVMDDDGCEVFCGGVNVGEGVNVKVC